MVLVGNCGAVVRHTHNAIPISIKIWTGRVGRRRRKHTAGHRVTGIHRAHIPIVTGDRELACKDPIVYTSILPRTGIPIITGRADENVVGTGLSPNTRIQGARVDIIAGFSLSDAGPFDAGIADGARVSIIAKRPAFGAIGATGLGITRVFRTRIGIVAIQRASR